jgi:3-oxoacyl-[acyl-carrier-protein] synthase II
MRSALRDASLQPSSIGYVNAHATSTPVGDAIEADALQGVFGSSGHRHSGEGDTAERKCPLYVSSTKGATGHMLGAAGAVEAAFTAMAVSTGVLPPTLNLTLSEPTNSTMSGAGDLIRPAFRHITGKSVTMTPELGFEYGMSNSFGFGGTNASLIFRKYSDN